MKSIDIEIAADYVGYDSIISEFTKKKLEERYETLYKTASEFIDKMGYKNNVCIDDYALLYAMFDYFADISRLKKFHKIDLINDIKIASYEAYWLLKRKVLQVFKCSMDTIYVNEQFVLTLILKCLSDKENISVASFGNEKLKFFFDTFFYSLKYRPFDQQAIELIALSFNAGRVYSEIISKNEVLNPRI